MLSRSLRLLSSPTHRTKLPLSLTTSITTPTVTSTTHQQQQQIRFLSSKAPKKGGAKGGGKPPPVVEEKIAKVKKLPPPPRPVKSEDEIAKIMQLLSQSEGAPTRTLHVIGFVNVDELKDRLTVGGGVDDYVLSLLNPSSITHVTDASNGKLSKSIKVVLQYSPSDTAQSKDIEAETTLKGKRTKIATMLGQASLALRSLLHNTQSPSNADKYVKVFAPSQVSGGGEDKVTRKQAMRIGVGKLGTQDSNTYVEQMVERFLKEKLNAGEKEAVEGELEKGFVEFMQTIKEERERDVVGSGTYKMFTDELEDSEVNGIDEEGFDWSSSTELTELTQEALDALIEETVEEKTESETKDVFDVFKTFDDMTYASLDPRHNARDVSKPELSKRDKLILMKMDMVLDEFENDTWQSEIKSNKKVKQSAAGALEEVVAIAEKVQKRDEAERLANPTEKRVRTKRDEHEEYDNYVMNASSKGRSQGALAADNYNSSHNSNDNDDDEDEDLGEHTTDCDWSETIVKVDRVQKVTRGGVIMRYRALIVCGNAMGAGSFGIGKAASPREAIALASRSSRQGPGIVYVDRMDETGLCHDLMGRHNSTSVALRSVPKGYGMSAGPLISEMLYQVGITDCSAKSHGSSNVYSVVRAFFKALKTHESLEEIGGKRGRRIVGIERARKLGV